MYIGGVYRLKKDNWLILLLNQDSTWLAKKRHIKRNETFMITSHETSVKLKAEHKINLAKYYWLSIGSIK